MKKIKLNKTNKIILAVHVAMLLVVLAAAGVVYKKYWHIAEVNGVEIRRVDYYKTLEQQGGAQVLDGMIQEAMIMQEAKKNKVTVDQAVIDADIAKIEEQIKAQGQTLEAALTSQGMTKDDLVRQVRLKKLVTQMAKPAEVTQAQVDKFISDNKAQLPAKATKAELEKLAKDELTLEAGNTAITNWLAELKKNAKVIYK